MVGGYWVFRTYSALCYLFIISFSYRFIRQGALIDFGIFLRFKIAFLVVLIFSPPKTRTLYSGPDSESTAVANQ